MVVLRGEPRAALAAGGTIERMLSMWVIVAAVQVAAADASCVANLPGNGTEVFQHCQEIGGFVHLFWNLDDASVAHPQLHMLAQADASKAAGYLAVGFGNTAGKMVPASVAAAVVSKIGASMVHDWRLDAYALPNNASGHMSLSNVSVAVADGVKTLRFSRPLVCADKEVEDITRGAKTNIIVAIKSTPGWGYHDSYAAESISMESNNDPHRHHPTHTPASCVANLPGNGTEVFQHCQEIGGFVHLFWNLDDASVAHPQLHMLAQADASKAAGYLAVGFGNTAGKMVPASVAAAVVSKIGTSMVHDWRLDAYALPNNASGHMSLSKASVAVADGVKTLRFSRPLVCADKEVEDITRGAKTNIIVAIKSTPGWGYHDSYAAESISMQTGEIATQIPWSRIHAYSMMATWGLVAPAAVIVTRFGRYSSTGYLPRGAVVGALKPAAYKVHLGMQVTVVIVTLAGCAIGLFKIGGPGHPVHKTLGIVITAIVGVQFVLGLLCRPKPDASTRKIWNFVHHWLGRAAVICAWVNFYYGLHLLSPLAQHGSANTTSTIANWVAAYAPPLITVTLFLGLEARRICCAPKYSDLERSLNA